MSSTFLSAKACVNRPIRYRVVGTEGCPWPLGKERERSMRPQSTTGVHGRVAIKAQHPDDPHKTIEVYISAARLRKLAGASGWAYHNATIAFRTLKCPEAIHSGIRESANGGRAGWCYVSDPPMLFSKTGEEYENKQRDRILFAVYVDEDRNVFHWCLDPRDRQNRMMPDTQEI